MALGDWLRRLMERRGNTRLSAKLSMLIILSGFLPLAFALLLFNRYTTTAFYNSVRVSAEDSFLQLYDIVSSNFEVVRKNAQLLLAESNSRELLQEETRITDPLERIRVKTRIGAIISFAENPSIWDMRISIFLRENGAYLVENQTFFPYDIAMRAPWYDMLTQCPYKNAWMQTHAAGAAVDSADDAGILYLVRVFNPRNYSETTSILQISFSRAAITENLRQALLPMEGVGVYLTGADGEIILHAERGEQPLPLPDKQALRFTTTTWDTQAQSGTSYHVLSRAFRNNPWQLVMIVPFGSSYQTLLDDGQWMRVLLPALIGGVLIVLVSVLFVRGISSRIAQVCQGMQSLKDGVLHPLPESRQRDEVSVLVESYNYLTEELTMLTRTRALAGARLRQTELKALQAQINPHFLYNTLEMINYFAYLEQPKQVERIVNLLASFYKLCLNRGAEVSLLGKEIELARTYMSIQDIRYEGRIRLVCEIPPALESCEVLHIILQPIIENAIYHGILPHADGTGEIRLEARAEEGTLFITVSDDGVGITESCVRQITQGLQIPSGLSAHGSHYGLRNIHERLRITYGDGSGLSFHSAPGKGTVVTISLPVIVNPSIISNGEMIKGRR
jgi:two-component system sensor histidine kinase YesM